MDNFTSLNGDFPDEAISEPAFSFPLADLIEICDRLSQARLLVLGDIMLDRFVRGRVTRISPEAPIPILAIEDELSMPGGAGNVVRNLVSLGAQAAYAGAVGDDEAGRTLAALLSAFPGPGSHLVISKGRRTPIKARYVAGPTHLLRTDYETVAHQGSGPVRPPDRGP